MDKPGGVHGSVCRWPRVRVGGSASASGTCNGCPLGRKSAGRLLWIAAVAAPVLAAPAVAAPPATVRAAPATVVRIIRWTALLSGGQETEPVP